MEVAPQPQRPEPAQWPDIIEELRRRLIASGAQRIYLFGSYARGEADEDSNVDVLVIQETPRPFLERLRAVATCLDPDWPVDLLVYTPAEFDQMRREGNAFAELLCEEGVLLYG
jgi:predicted nucleotidyltransferase